MTIQFDQTTYNIPIHMKTTTPVQYQPNHESGTTLILKNIRFTITKISHFSGEAHYGLHYRSALQDHYVWMPCRFMDLFASTDQNVYEVSTHFLIPTYVLEILNETEVEATEYEEAIKECYRIVSHTLEENDPIGYKLSQAIRNRQ